MKILVTGHLGYIGTVLTPMLLDRGHDVVGLDADLFRKCTFAGALTDIPCIGGDIRTFVEDDVRAIEHLRGFDAIFTWLDCRMTLLAITDRNSQKRSCS